MKNCILAGLLIAIACSACRKDIEQVTVVETPIAPSILQNWSPVVEPVLADLTGYITNQDGTPIPDASVKLNEQTTKTDAFGHFSFKSASLNARGSLVQVNKEGFFPGSRRFFSTANANNRVRIQLMEKVFDHTFSSETGAEIEMNGGASVNFTPNSISTSDGIPYTGTVKVAAKWLDPEDINTFDRMPGNLQGVDTNSEEVALTTAGMMVVEIEGENGESLNLREGFTAEISMPIPSYLQSDTPTEVPNWSYNEEYGMWVEEGVSKLVGNHYVGQVSHFSYWNYDFKDPLVSFTATILSSDGTPLENHKVVIRQEGSGLYGSGLTTSEGTIYGLVPQDYDLILEVYGRCNELFYSEAIGSFSSDTDLGAIFVPESDLSIISITGSLVDCEGSEIQDGVVILEIDGNTIYHYINSNPFVITVEKCQDSSSFTLIAHNFETTQQSLLIEISPEQTPDFGNISVCETATNYFRINVDGVESTYFNIKGRILGAPLPLNNQTLFHDNTPPLNLLWFRIYAFSPGQYGGNEESYLTLSVSDNFWFFDTQILDTLVITSHGGAIGEYVTGYFGGQIINSADNSNPVQVNVSGDFSILLSE